MMPPRLTSRRSCQDTMPIPVTGAPRTTHSCWCMTSRGITSTVGQADAACIWPRPRPCVASDKLVAGIDRMQVDVVGAQPLLRPFQPIHDGDGIAHFTPGAAYCTSGFQK